MRSLQRLTAHSVWPGVIVALLASVLTSGQPSVTGAQPDTSARSVRQQPAVERAAAPDRRDRPAREEAVAQATVTVDAREVLSDIDPRLRGLHIPAWNETAIVDGALDPRLRSGLERVGPRFVVFPGGGFGLDWEWNAPNSPNEMTTRQFLDIARDLDATAKISVNPNRPAKLAADWVRHTKGRVLYWEIADEPWFYMSVDEFIAKMREFVPAMKKANPSIRIVTNVNPIRQEWTKKVIAEVGDLTDVWSVHFFPLPPSKALDPTSPYSKDEKEKFYEDLLRTPTQLTKQFGDLRTWVEEAHPGESFEYHLGSWAPIWSGPEDWTMNALPDGLWAADVFGTAATLGLDAAANWAMMNPYPPGKGDFGLWSPEGRQYVIADAAELWHRHFGTTLVRTESDDDLVSTYASLSKDREKLYVLLVNKRPDTAVETSFSLTGVRPRGDGAAWILDGPTNPDHLSDYGLRRETVEGIAGEFTWTVPSYSAVALEIPVSRKAELDAPPDIAQDKFATASSVAFHDDDGEWRTDDFVADRAIDGDPTTRWASEAFLDKAQWFSVDLGQSQALDRIELHWEYWSTGYTVEVSDDGETWREVATTSDAVRLEPEPQPVERIDLSSPVIARHIRVSMTGRPTVSGQKAGSSTWTPKAFSLWEFDVYLRS